MSEIRTSHAALKTPNRACVSSRSLMRLRFDTGAAHALIVIGRFAARVDCAIAGCAFEHARILAGMHDRRLVVALDAQQRGDIRLGPRGR